MQQIEQRREVRGWAATIEAPSLRDLRREIGRAHRAGELAASGPVHLTPTGGYRVQVWRLKERSSAVAWRRPVLVAGGVLLVLGAAGAVGWWLVGATASALAAVPLPAAAGVLAIVAGLRALLRPRGCTVTVTHTRH